MQRNKHSSGLTGPELKALANARNVNPYFLAYALVTGAECCKEAFDRDGSGIKFVHWNEGRWDEQAKAEGVSRDVVSILDGASDRHTALCATFIPADINPTE